MKYLFYLLLISSASTLYAQAPPRGINYQAVIRDAAGEPLANATVEVLVDIVGNGGTVYAELFSGATTDEYGLLQLVIGSGAAQGILFSQVDWNQGEHYLELHIRSAEVDITVPRTQFQTVPYAQLAETTADPLWERGDENSLIALGDRVGIGTTSPAELLTVYNSGRARIRVQSRTDLPVGIDFVRGRDDLETDWRLETSLFGEFRFGYSRDGFTEEPNWAMTITESGIAIGSSLFPQTALHVAGSGTQLLRVQSTDGTAGVGFWSSTGTADFRMVNRFGRWRLLRSTDNFDTSTDVIEIEGDGVLRIHQSLNMTDQQIVNVAPPTGGQHVVNRNYLEDYVADQFGQRNLFPSGMSSEATQLTFEGCATRCRTLVEDGFSNWGMPSLDQISQFAGSNAGDLTRLWTTTMTNPENDYDALNATGKAIPVNRLIGRFTMQLTTGDIERAEGDAELGCRCVR